MDSSREERIRPGQVQREVTEGLLHDIRKEIEMGLYDELGLDPEVDENDFTAADAAKVFGKASDEMAKAEMPIEVLNIIKSAAFVLLQTLKAGGIL